LPSRWHVGNAYESCGCLAFIQHTLATAVMV
jgi:hypothetical protein